MNDNEKKYDLFAVAGYDIHEADSTGKSPKGLCHHQ